MAAIQRCAQSTLNWDHFETEGLLLLQMHPAILPQVTIVGLAIVSYYYWSLGILSKSTQKMENIVNIFPHCRIVKELRFLSQTCFWQTSKSKILGTCCLNITQIC